ncbi:MAG TPA: magnesium transporter [Acidobacteriota bacterium]|nr:magnesium transporter [Acidobacteriota bacterium]HNH81219.1 magnesium transporter [Acidobacteriota bacterium]
MSAKTKNTMTPERLAKLRDELRSNPQAVSAVIDRLKAPDVAEVLNDFLLDDAILAIMTLDPDEIVAVFNEPSFERRPALIQLLHIEQAARIITGLSSDERVDIIQKLVPEFRARLMPYLPDKIQRETNLLLEFDPATAGGIMSTEYVRLDPSQTVAQALEFVRSISKNRLHVYSAYVLDPQDRLLGAISLRDLVVSDPEQLVSQIMRKYPISVHFKEDQELVARKLAKYNLLAVPVVDDSQRILGFVTVDDALDVMVEEQTEDLQKLGGMQALEDGYMNTPLWQLAQKRAGWLVVLLLGEMLTATAMSYFEGEIQKAVVLALFVPLIISSGGNSGSQAATLIIRALALNDARLDDWWIVMQRELISGLLLGGILGVIGFLRIAVWSLFSPIYGPHWALVGVTVGISLLGVVLLGTLCGSMLPFILKRIGADPATSSAPFVATIVDVAGLVMYFTVALLILRGKLL